MMKARNVIVVVFVALVILAALYFGISMMLSMHVPPPY
jgi:hypothetical protein